MIIVFRTLNSIIEQRFLKTGFQSLCDCSLLAEHEGLR